MRRRIGLRDYFGFLAVGAGLLLALVALLADPLRVGLPGIGPRQSIGIGLGVGLAFSGLIVLKADPLPRQESTPNRARAMWSIAAFLVALLALPVPLISPPPHAETELCGEFRQVIGGHGYMENCDSIAFWRLAEHPKDLLVPGEIRQSRPSFVLLGMLSRAAVAPIVSASHTADSTAASRVGYVVLNIALLAIAVGFCGQLLRSVDTPWPIIASVVTVLVVNDIIKVYVWTAHTQIFNILVPLALVAMVTRGLNGEFTQRQRFLIGLCFGILVLAYASFFVGLPLLLISGEISRRRSGAPLSPSMVIREAALFVLFLAPTLLWVTFASVVADGFYSHEIGRYRQFVWILDAARNGLGELVSQSTMFTKEFLSTFVAVETTPFLLLFLAALSSFLVRRRLGTSTGRDSDVQLASLLTVGTLTLFLWPVGFYSQRISFSLVPALLVFVALELRARWSHSSKVLNASLLVATSSWVLVHLVRAGPYN